MSKVTIEGFRLSPQQEHLWLLQPEGAPAYRAQCAISIEGVLDQKRLRDAVDDVVRRHEILRTTFRYLPEMTIPLQVIGEGEIEWTDEDLSHLEDDDKAARAGEIFRQLLTQPFNFEQESLLQASLLKLDAKSHLLVLSMPSLCMDSAGLKNLVSEIGRSYTGPQPDQDGPLQYADISELLNEVIEAEDSAPGREFWRRQDIFSFHMPALSFERAPTAERNFTPEVVSLSLDESCSELAEDLGTTTETLLLACWYALLWRYVKQDQMVLGVEFSLRKYGPVQEALGLFAKHLPLRCRMDGEQRFIELVDQLEAAAKEAYKWQESFSWEQLGDGTKSHYSPYAFAFSDQSTFLSTPDISFLIGREFVCYERFKLKLCGLSRGNSLSIEVHYDRGLFSEEDARRLASQFQQLLTSVLKRPDVTLAELNILDDNARRQVLYEFNQTRVDYGAPNLIHKLVEAQAERTPEAIAIIAGDAQLSYRELNDRANRLAHFLIREGAGSGVPAGICVDRSVEMIVGLLGILKAGGAYLPLDASLPQRRLEMMLADARPRFILTQQHLRESLPVSQDNLFYLDGDWSRVAGESVGNPNQPVSDHAPAYIIYTSGSTGTPKGVVISHRAICNRLLWLQAEYPLTAEDRLLQKTVFNFDASVWEIFVPLLAGAQLVLAEAGEERDASYLVRAVAEQHVTVLQVVPSMLALMLEEPGVENLTSLRRVFCGGEALPVAVASRFYARLNAQLVNLYGPTESSIDATSFSCTREALDQLTGRATVPIGKPLANICVYVLDERGQPVPPGVAGELHIGGIGLAHGYLNRPDLTADKFVPDPFSPEPGARIYRTGDLARYTPEGDVEFLGRLDHQVKIRGFRIELGEIEAVLMQHPQVRSGLVAVREDESSEQRMVAYVVPQQSADMFAGQLYRLPNNLQVAHLNRNETEVLYKEIFEDESYLRHDIKLSDESCVFDVGANIGMFSLFVQQRWPRAQVHAFEPIPTTYEVLKTNIELHGLNVKHYNCGLSARSGTARFTFYPLMSAMSGMYTDTREDETLTRAFMENQDERFSAFAGELLEGRFAAENFVCPLKTISEVIRENNIERIDLLKLDVEKAELDVLRGIADDDWSRIKQLVIEVHDQDGRLQEITDLLHKHGFNVVCEQDALLTHTSLYNLYAVHPSRAEVSNGDGAEKRNTEHTLSAATLRSYLRENLPEYMIPSAFVMLKALPLLPNGKVDLRALPAPEAIRPELDQDFAAPHTPVEEVLAGIWSQILNVERVGINDNFFDLGGHSLLVTQVTSRLRQVFRVNLPLRSMFESPTIAGLAKKVEDAIREGEDLQIPPITPVPRDRLLPLSFAQQRLWFLQQLDADSTAYNLPRAIRLNGPLNVAALQRTLDEIVRRHESLRTTFEVVDGQPVQVIHPPAPVDMPLTDLGHLSLEERESTARMFAREEAARPFDLSAGPLMRIGLLRLGPDEHIALLTMHHVISDAWSFGVFINEISTLYSTFLSKRTTPLTDLPIQYADYAVWQREWLSGGELESQLAYWKSQLSGELPILQLPLDRLRPAVQTFNGAIQTTVLPRELTSALKAFSRQEGVTLFMAGLATFQTLLHRYSGQTDILVGSPIAGRHQAETEALIGFFINTLVTRTDLSGDPTFRELLQRVRESALGAYTHQDLPFEKLVEELHPRRDLSRSPLFQVMFNLHNAPVAAPNLSGVTISFLDATSVTSKFDLTMTMLDTGTDLITNIEYNTDLFDEDTIRRMAGHFESLLESLVANPLQHLSELSLLTPADRHQLVVEWNQTEVNYGVPRALHELIEAQVARTPEATALVFEDAEVSYSELNQRANKIARHMQSLGVGPDVTVGVCMERSVELVVGLLGILKAGGAYLPLDPAYPSQRLEFMVADARPPVLLTQQHLLNTLPAREAQVVCLDAPEWKATVERDAENPPSKVSNLNLAYVIYTSGSTGRPKGAMNTHGAIVNRLLWMQDAYGLTPADRVLQKTPFSFDVSVWEFFWPLMTGARLILARAGGHQDPTYLAELIVRQQITTVHFVPSMLQIFIGCSAAGNCTSLKRVICSGEALSHELQERFHAFLPAELHNLYGPTEAAVDVTAWACERGGQRYSIPIGRPIANTTIYILDSRLCPVPVGAAGELHIGGIGVARGYLNRPELTADRFIPDPFSATQGTRLYKTGDLARYWPNGEIEYLGRLDFQVKMRGLRIELEEIDAVLAEHEAVREVVVVAREDKPGDVRLVAYVVCRDKPAVASGELRRHAREKLPDYMIPSAFVLLDELPLSPNGKLDRRALPEPEWLTDADDYTAPRTATEEIVAGIWMEVLGVRQVSVHDNFFDIGGHSLLATQVTSRVRQTFHVELLLRKVFEKPTVEGLAEVIDSMVQEKQGVSLAPPLQRIARTPGMPLSFAQQRLWFLNQLEPESPFYNVTMAVRINGRLDSEALEKAFQEIVRRHETLRTTFSSIDGKPVQVIASDMTLQMPLVHLEQLPENEREDRVELLVLEETQREFNLETGPLFAVTLLKLAEDKHVAIIALHHIVGDGWSLGVLIEEVASLYETRVKGLPSPLPELPVQYADFAHWQRDWLAGEGLEMHLDYWRKQLAGAPPLLVLPADYARPAVPTYQGAHANTMVSDEVAEALRLLSRAEGATLFMTLLAAFDILLARYTTQTNIVVGTPIANRNRVEVEKLIGFFANTLVLRADLSGNPTFRELLRRTRDLALEAYAHQDVPFEKLVEELDPERELSHSPLFQVMFGVQNVAMPGVALPEVNLSPMTVESGVAKFDLSLFMFEGGSDLKGRLEYSTDLFSDDTVTRMIGHFQRLLASIVSNPDQRIEDLPMLTADERLRLLEEWNHTKVSDQKGLSIWQALQSRFETIPPDATAVVFYGETLTYAELNERANRLANRLQQLGVGPDSLVGICMERSPEMIVALLAVIKADGAYVPLDASYPPERLAVMLNDARPLVLLTQEHLAATLPAHDSRLVLVDAERDSIASESPEAPISRATGDNLGYVIYTSGSTGKPKGIAMRQGALANLMIWETRGATSAGPRTLQFASVSFDVSFQDIFSTLFWGGAIVLISQEDRLDSHALLRVITEQQVERVTLPVVALQQLSETAEELGVVPSSLRDVGASGDRLQVTKPIADWLTKLGCTLRNQYGPSENHVMMENTLEGHPSSWPSLPSIGRPIDNARIYVLDQSLNPVPVGVTGELYIGGECLSRGYLNKPDMTAERFVPDLYGPEPGARLYKSGDLVRFVAEGTLEFVGRNDFQVKLRGFRIELGEIEAVLSEHPSVQGVVVIVNEDDHGQKRLIAYAVTDGRVENSELRSFLKERLPDYMVPSAIVLLDQFPLTANGKINRQALPAPGATPSDMEETYVAPRTPVEEVMADIFAEVIGVERVGATGNFFDLGGHSLLATLVMSRIRKAFDVELPLRRIFEAPTVEGLAGVVESELFAGQKPEAPAIVPVSRSKAIPLTFLQEYFWHIAQQRPPTFYHIETQFNGAFDAAVFERVLNEIVRRHEILRTTFSEFEGQLVQVIHDYEPSPLPFVDLSHLPHEEQRSEVSRLSAEQTAPPFDLAIGPLLRTSLVRLSDDEHVLLLTLTHLIVDRWSLKVLANEVMKLYDAFNRGLESPLAELPVQYADFAYWQRTWMQGEILRMQLDYWRKHLIDAPPLLELPADFARLPVQTYNGANLAMPVDEAVTRQLKKLSREAGTTLFMTMLTSYNILLNRYSGQENIVVGTATSGRKQVVTEGLIGVFVNQIVMHTDLTGNPSFLELLGRVREVALGAYAHEDMPFEKLIQELRPVQDSSYAPIAQVGFVLHSLNETSAPAALRMTPAQTYSTRSPYDLVLRILETPAYLMAHLEYNTDLFKEDTIKRILDDYTLLLQQIVLNPDWRLADFQLSQISQRHHTAAS